MCSSFTAHFSLGRNLHMNYILKIGLLSVSLLLTGCGSITYDNHDQIQERLAEVTTQNLSELTFQSSDQNQEELIQLMQNGLPKEKQVLFRSIYEDKTSESIVLEPLYISEKLDSAMSSAGIVDVESFNNFLTKVEFDPSPVLYSPIALIKDRKGNCYAHTLMTMFFIDKYHPEISYEIITDVGTQGEPHIYLKLKSDSEELICDLTVTPVLTLPTVNNPMPKVRGLSLR